MFWCIPPSGCEWQILRPFVEFINKKYNANYTLEKCLDVRERNKPAPEILIYDKNSGSRIVIERKNIVWPRDKIKFHDGEHLFFDTFLDRITSSFAVSGNDAYKLIVHGPFQASKKKIKSFAEEIARLIGCNIQLLESRRSIVCKKPIPWRFEKLLEHEREEDEKGIGVEIWEDNELTEPHHFVNANNDIIEILTGKILDASRKFTSFSYASRYLLLYFYCEMLTYETVVSMFKSINVPDNIDQIGRASCRERV